MCENTYINIQTGEELDLQKVSELKVNAMLNNFPNLWIEWDFEKNDELGLDIWKMTKRNGKKVWWLGECGHVWEATIANRTRPDRKNKCPYCSSNTRKVLNGFNDIHTTHPKIASLLVNLDDGYRYSKGSDAIVDWKCSECGGILTRAIKDAIRRSVSCAKCADGISVGEKTIYYLLLDNGICFDYDKTNSFSNSRRYDFYLPEYNSIIEIHGEQHYKQATGTFGENRSLEEELKNDKYKRELAIKNGISNYFEIAILDNDIHKIREEIENSGLLKILNLSDINWLDISTKSQKSLVLDVCRYYKENDLLTTSDIAYLFRLTQTTVIRYLKVGNELKICNYNPGERHTKTINSSKKSSKPVVKLTINKEFIEKYDSISEAHRSTGINNIGLCCRENYRTANNFKWMYLSDYENKYGKLT